MVGNFVRWQKPPLAYTESIRPEEYAGFHLIAGDRRTVAHIATDVPARLLDDGIFAISKASAGIDWPKIVVARQAMAAALEEVTCSTT